MKWYLSCLVLTLLMPPARAGSLKHELRFGGPDAYSQLRLRFGPYGYRSASCLLGEASGLRVRVPGVAGSGQTGVYSYFSLAGDCQVVVSYEFLKLASPQGGYGSGAGLAFDVGKSRGMIQRIRRRSAGGEESGFLLSCTLDAKQAATDRFIASGSPRGRMGLRRVGKELVYLAADEATGEAKEVGRLSFTDATVQAVRLFADPGGSPTPIDVRFAEVNIAAEEITGGVPARERRASWWWLLATPGVAVGVVLLWRWRARR